MSRRPVWARANLMTASIPSLPEPRKEGPWRACGGACRHKRYANCPALSTTVALQHGRALVLQLRHQLGNNLGMIMPRIVDTISRQAVKNGFAVLGVEFRTAGACIPNVHSQQIEKPDPYWVHMTRVEIAAVKLLERVQVEAGGKQCCHSRAFAPRGGVCDGNHRAGSPSLFRIQSISVFGSVWRNGRVQFTFPLHASRENSLAKKEKEEEPAQRDHGDYNDDRHGIKQIDDGEVLILRSHISHRAYAEELDELQYLSSLKAAEAPMTPGTPVRNKVLIY